MALTGALGFMGAVALLGAIALFVQNWRAHRGTIVTGEVVSLDTRLIDTAHRADIDHPVTRTYAPVVEFADEHGQRHQVEANLSGTQRLEIGSSVQVSYRPGNPEGAIVMQLPSQAPAKWVFLVVGLVCAAGAVIAGMR